tara:strand:+ start:3049 stop:3309 length:261 start_codon:yes stop_codon:yes gene_type:complete
MTSEYRGLGLNGGIYINGTAVVTNSNGWFAIQATEDTVIQAQASNITDLDNICQPVDNITLAAGTVLYGNFTSIDLTSGAVIAYNI